MASSTFPAATVASSFTRIRGAVENRLAPAVKTFLKHPVATSRMTLVIGSLPVLERLLPLPRMLRALTPIRAVGDTGGGTPALAEAAVASHRPVLDALLALRVGRFRDNCMTRSLVLFYCLRRAAIPVSVHFGIARRGEDQLNGHCWLQLGNRPIAEDPRELSHLHPIYHYPAP